MDFSIPSDLAILERTRDGAVDEVSDHFYVGDTGGNVWRVSLVDPGTPSTWTVTKLASVGGAGTANARKFLFPTSVVFAVDAFGNKFEAVVMGSGDREQPFDTSVTNRVYMFKETDIGVAGMWADQTWMASIGSPGTRALAVWGAIRDARDAAIALLERKLGAGEPVRGGEADDAARAVIEARGFGPAFTHRTGDSIDRRGLHGMGPNIDNLETREAPRPLDQEARSIQQDRSPSGLRMKHSHYFKKCPYHHIDIYRILLMYEVTDACLSHAIKKLLVAGGKGSKEHPY